MSVSKSHPRYESLRTREELIKYWKRGFVVTQGLLAHGRGEAFDYLLGERTIVQARKAAEASAALLILAERPVLSINGNTAALAAKDIVKLAQLVNARIEVNLFHRTAKRVNRISALLKNYGAGEVLGENTNARIPNLEHGRALCTRTGIFNADVVLVALEDGDRAEALISMGKKVIAVDLNPLSRTARAASITIVDNVTRALKEVIRAVKNLKSVNREELKARIKNFDNNRNLKEVLSYISKRLKVIKWY